MKLSSTRLSVAAVVVAAAGLSVWGASSSCAPAHASARDEAAASPGPAIARAEEVVSQMKTEQKVERLNAVLDASAAPDLAALAKQQAVSGNAAVGALLTELSLEKDEYQAIHAQYRAAEERHTALVIRNPKSDEVKQADLELDRLLAEMRDASARIQKLTNEAMAAYTADKMAELGIAQR